MAEKHHIDKENVEPKKKRLSLSLNKKNTSRFGSTSKETLKAMATVTLPKNSAHSSKWATKNLRDWLVDYNYRNPENECPEDLLSPFCSKEILNKWLCIYVTETPNQDRDAYPPKTIYELLCGIL